jgi:hypothetical protein
MLSGVLASFLIIILILMYVNKKIMSKTKQILDQQGQGSELGQSRRSIKLNQISIAKIQDPQIRPRPLNKREWQTFEPKFKVNKTMTNSRDRVPVVGTDNMAYVEDF